jgi:hypothetical protein
MAWNEKSISWEGTEVHDMEVAEMNKKVMSWVVSTDMDLQNSIDDLLKLLLVDGTVAVKKIWKPYWTYVTRRVPKEITADNIMRGVLDYEVKYDYIQRERCFIELRPLERVYFPYDANSSEKKWEDHFNIIDERWYTMADLKEMQLDGVMDKNVDLGELEANLLQNEDIQATLKARMDAEGSQPVTTLLQDKVL